MSNQFQPLAEGEVVSIDNTYRVSELTAKIRSKVADALSEWSSEQGVDGEALRFGSTAWQKGKLRLNLSIEFAPDDGAGSAAVPSAAANVMNAPGVAAAPISTSAPSNAPTAQHVTAVAAVATSVAAPIAVAAAVSTPAETTVVAEMSAPEAQSLAPKIESTLEDDNFTFGTMSDVTGEIEMNLSDSEEDHTGYVDFDLSAAMLDINLDELISQADSARTSLIDEVWNEMSQPNWPGVSRA